MDAMALNTDASVEFELLDELGSYGLEMTAGDKLCCNCFC